MNLTLLVSLRQEKKVDCSIGLSKEVQKRNTVNFQSVEDSQLSSQKVEGSSLGAGVGGKLKGSWFC